MNLSGIKFNLTYVIVGAVVIIILVVLGIYFYRQGKKQVTIQSLPGQLPGDTSGSSQEGASNDEIKNIVSGLYDDMNGWNILGHKQAPYDQANLLNDRDIVKLYNAFNAQYQKDSGSTLTQWLEDESGLGVAGTTLITRLKKLNCK